MASLLGQGSLLRTACLCSKSSKMSWNSLGETEGGVENVLYRGTEA